MPNYTTRNAPQATARDLAAAEYTHLAITFADCIDALPPALARNLSDLKELDAVLNPSLVAMTHRLNALLRSVDTDCSPEHRLNLLREVAAEARELRLGGEDKIRVATGTCETIAHHKAQLDILANLLHSLLPQPVSQGLPPPSWPQGYPVAFPADPSTLAGAYRSRTQFFAPPNAYGRTNASPATNQYNAAVEAVRGYVKDGLPLAPDSRRRAAAAASAAATAEIVRPPPYASPGKKRERSTNGVGYAAGPTTLSAAASINPYQPTPAEKRKATMAAKGDSDYVDNASPPKKVRRTASQTNAFAPSPQPAPALPPIAIPEGGAVDPEYPSLPSPAPSANGSARGRSETRVAVTKSNLPSPAVSESTTTSKRRAPIKKGSMNDLVNPVSSAMSNSGSTTKRKPSIISEAPLSPNALQGVDARIPSGRARGNSTANYTVDEPEAEEVEEQPVTDGADPVDERTYCYCNRVSFGQMIGCDGEDCKHEWFHLACVKMTEAPQGEWLCDDCAKYAAELENGFEERPASNRGKKRKVA